MSNIDFGSGFIVVTGTWPDVKNTVVSRGLQLQAVFQDELDNPNWVVYAVDDKIVFKTLIYSDEVPTVGGVTQEDNDVYKTEFLAYPNVNQRIGLKQQGDKALLVSVVGREGRETIWATHNFADKTTWYNDSVRVTTGTLYNSGNDLLFSGSNNYWIDMSHGKVFDEDALASDIDHGYAVSLTVDGTPKTPRAPFASSGGDYTINYRSGSVTFASPVTGTVLCSYSYASGSTWVLRPYPNKALDIEEAEAQFSADCVMKDTLHFTIFGNAEVFAPELVASGSLQIGDKVPLEETKYKTIFQMIDEALGSYPVIPKIGTNTNGRMNDNPMYGFPFTYNAVRRLLDGNGVELRVYLENHEEYEGERATATFYCVTRNDEEIE